MARGSAATQAPFDAIAPATGAVIGPQFAEAGEADVNLAALAAASAFEATRDLPPRWQADLLDAIAAKIMDLGDALLERAETETALPRGRLTMERGRTANQLKMFAEVVRDGSWVDATIDTADPEAHAAAEARRAPDAPPARAGRRCSGRAIFRSRSARWGATPHRRWPRDARSS